MAHFQFKDMEGEIILPKVLYKLLYIVAVQVKLRLKHMWFFLTLKPCIF